MRTYSAAKSLELAVSEFHNLLIDLGMQPSMISHQQAEEMYLAADHLGSVSISDERSKAQVRKRAASVKFMDIWKLVRQKFPESGKSRKSGKPSKLQPIRSSAEKVATRLIAHLAELLSRGISIKDFFTTNFHQSGSVDLKTFARCVFDLRESLSIGIAGVSVEDVREAVRFFDINRDLSISHDVLEAFANSFNIVLGGSSSALNSSEFSFGPAALVEVLLKIGIRHRLLFPDSPDQSTCPTQLSIIWFTAYLAQKMKKIP